MLEHHALPVGGQQSSLGVTRRNFLRAGCGLLAGGAVLCASGSLYTLLAEPSWIEVTEVELRLPGLPEREESLTVVQLSDLHAGPYVSAADVRRSVEMANALEADAIVLTGDLVYRSASYSLACARELSGLRAKHGVFAVLGNHDIWTNADEVAANLSRAGVDVLRNDVRSLTIAGSDLWLVGVEDTGYAGTDFGEFRAIWDQAVVGLERMLETIPADSPRILLVHNPDFSEMLPEGRIDLVLSGHTHGGQVRVPFLGPPIVPSCFGQRYVGGLVAGPRAPVYVNRGIGVISPPVRFNCRPEITRLKLLPGRAHEIEVSQ